LSRRENNNLTCTLDFFPTFCDWAQVDKNKVPPLEGKSFEDFCEGKETKGNWNEIFVGISNINTVITDDGYRLTLFGNGEGQMFNLFKDPEEQNNLFNKPKYQDKKIELLLKLVKVSNQPRMTPQYRNIPVKAGKKFLPNKNKSLYYYDFPESPWLKNEDKFEWHA
jgi:arylsulfatase A-like enzyme